VGILLVVLSDDDEIPVATRVSRAANATKVMNDKVGIDEKNEREKAKETDPQSLDP